MRRPTGGYFFIASSTKKRKRWWSGHLLASRRRVALRNLTETRVHLSEVYGFFGETIQRPETKGKRFRVETSVWPKNWPLHWSCTEIIMIPETKQSGVNSELKVTSMKALIYRNPSVHNGFSEFRKVHIISSIVWGRSKHIRPQKNGTTPRMAM